MKPIVTTCFLGLVGLSACSTPNARFPDQPSNPELANIVPTFDGRCFAKTAPVETTSLVTEEVVLVPEQTLDDGTVLTPAVTTTQTRTVTDVIAEGVEFETLCANELIPERVATLQRALRARLAYTGPVSGLYDEATQAAVRAFQAPEGFDSPQIARVVAQRLGLVPFGEEDTNAFQTPAPQ